MVFTNSNDLQAVESCLQRGMKCFIPGALFPLSRAVNALNLLSVKCSGEHRITLWAYKCYISDTADGIAC